MSFLTTVETDNIALTFDVLYIFFTGEVPAHGKSINAIKCNDTSIFTASR